MRLFLSPLTRLWACLSLLALLLVFGTGLRASAADANVIKSIAPGTLSGAPVIEITLTSTRPFTVRDAALLLQIGSATFYLSRSTADGDLNTIVFILPPSSFAATKTGDPVTGFFEGDSPSSPDAWQFGKLDKSLLK